MQRRHYEPEHEAFADAARSFLDKEVVPHYLDWERDGISPRDVFAAAGRGGFLGMAIPDEYGGGGTDDFRFNQALGEQVSYAGVTGTGLGLTLHNDICLPYFLAYCSDEQKQRWLPGIASGELITAIAMSEPAAGSDLQNIRTHARRDGSDWILSGSKTFITNGILSDLVLVVARTDPDAEGARGISLLAVERGMPGFERGRNLDKIGLKAQDTAELFFDEVRVPAENLVGEENRGFVHLMEHLPQERLSIAVVAVSACERVLELTLDYAKQRQAFGRPIGSFQHNRFLLAELVTETTVARAFLDECIRRHNAGGLSVPDAAMAKWWTTELQNKVADRCLQLHGGYGYMTEYPVSKAWLDGRVQSIYGGTNEVMKEIIGRSLGL